MNKSLNSLALKLAFLFVFIFSFQSTFAGLKGTYTMDSKGSGTRNFTTIYGFTAALYDSGVSGPVILNIADGYYYSYASINYGVTGSSSKNTITIQSKSGDSSKVTIDGPTSLSYCKWFIFKNITFANTGLGVAMTMSSCHCMTFTNCQFICSKMQLSYIGKYGPMGIYYTSDGDDSNFIVANCHFKYGLYGLYHSAKDYTTGKHSRHNKYTGNIFDSAYQYTLYLDGDSASEVSNNTISAAGDYYSIGMEIYRCADLDISKNKIYMTGGYGGGIYNYATPGKKHPVTFSNNLIVTGGTSYYGILSAGTYTRFYNNTCYNYSGSTSGVYAAYFEDKYPDIQNNIFASDTCYALGMNVTAISTCDHNDIRSTTGYLGDWAGTHYRTLSAWQLGTNLDSNSISKDPQFYSKTNLHIKNSSLSGKAKYLSAVPDDIDGQVRSTISSTIGADEITGGKAKFAVQSFCQGDSSVFTDSSFYYGSDSIKHWQWTFGDGNTSTSQNPKHLYSIGGNYTVKLKITTSLGISDSTSRMTYVDTTCRHLLKGTISISTGAALKNMKVYLATYTTNDTVIYMIDSTITDTGGFYSFRTMQDTVYLFAFPTLSAYPHELPTWTDTGLYFTDAKSIPLHMGTNLKNFRTVYGANPGGIGVIAGKISYCNMCKTFGSGNPASGVRVLLADSNGKVQEYTYINSLGYFSFANIAPAKYKIFVDQPLVKNNPAPVVGIDAANPFATSLTFTLYPTYLSLNVVNGIENKNINTGLNVYPNPANDRLNIEITNPSNGKIIICDLNGRELMNQLINSPNITLDISALPKGMYIARYQDKNGVINKTVVKE